MQLKSPTPRPWARRIGAATVALLALGTGFAVWSAQPAQPAAKAAPAASTKAEAVDGYHVVFDLRSDGMPPASFEAGGLFGSRFDLKHQDGRGNEIRIGGKIRRAGADRFDVDLVLQRNGAIVSKPRLIVARDEPGAVKIGEAGADGRFQGIELSMRVDDRGTPPRALSMVRTPAPVAAVAPLAPPMPVAAPAPVTPRAPVAAPAPVAPRTPKAAVASPSPPDAPAPPELPEPEQIVRSVRRTADHAEAARAIAVEARAAAERNTGNAEAARADAARAATAAKDAQEAARRAESIAALVDPVTAERVRARAAAMTPAEREAEKQAILGRIEDRRARLRAKAAEIDAGEAARAARPSPAPSAR